MKHFMDIKRIKPSFAEGFEVGDEIVIQEKIDGANFSIKYNEESDTVDSFSRKCELTYDNTLRGAFNWSKKLDKDLVKSVLGTNLILFGEWLVKHTVPYPKECYGKAYFYDVYDLSTEKYLPQDTVEEIVNRLGLIYVPVFYKGKFTNWQDVKSYVGKTKLGGEYGEGIVVKNQTKLNSANERLPFYTKIVSDNFCETKSIKKNKTENLEEREKLIMLTQTIVTRARVEKLINKMVDEGIIDEDWDSEHMSIIAKNLGRNIYNDCVKEEPKTVELVGEKFGKFASSEGMKIAKQILLEKTTYL